MYIAYAFSTLHFSPWKDTLTEKNAILIYSSAWFHIFAWVICMPVSKKQQKSTTWIRRILNNSFNHSMIHSYAERKKLILGEGMYAPSYSLPSPIWSRNLTFVPHLLPSIKHLQFHQLPTAGNISFQEKCFNCFQCRPFLSKRFLQNPKNYPVYLLRAVQSVVWTVLNNLLFSVIIFYKKLLLQKKLSSS